MSLHAINKQTFDYTCTSGEVAKTIQHEIENSTASMISQVIASCLEEEVTGDTSLRIEKLEIELGNVLLEDFGGQEMLFHFKDLFQQQIRKLQHEDDKYGGDSGQWRAPEHGTAADGAGSEWQVFEEWLLHGDIPWWTDKGAGKDLNQLVQHLISSDEKHFLEFLKSIGDDVNIFLRLMTSIDKKTRAHIDQASRGFVSELLSNALLKEHIKPGVFHFGHAWRADIESIIKAHTDRLSEITFHKLFRRLYSMHQQLLRSDLDIELSEDLSFIFVLFPAGPAAAKNEMQIREEWKHILRRSGEKKWSTLLLQLELLPSPELIIDLVTRHQINLQKEGTAGTEMESDGMMRAQGMAHINLYSGSVTLVRYPVAPADRKIKRAKVIFLYPEKGVKVLPLIGHSSALPLFEEIEIEGPRRKKTDAEINSAGSILEHKDEQPEQEERSGESSEGGKTVLTEPEAYARDHVEEEEVPEAGKPVFKKTKPYLFLPGLAGDTSQPGSGLKETRQQKSFPGQSISPGLATPVTTMLKKYMGEGYLQLLLSTFKKQKGDRQVRRSLEHILGHPYLLKYNLLQVFLDLRWETLESDIDIHPVAAEKPRQTERKPAGKYIRKIQDAQAAYAAVIRQLSIKDLVMYHAIIAGKQAQTSREKAFLRKLISGMRDEALLVMKFLTGIPESLLEEWLSSPGQPVLFERAINLNRFEEFSEDKQRKYYIDNAGLCLVAGYLPGLFKRLGYLDNKMFRDKPTACRAVMLLQYLADGKSKSREYLLQFNKLLCGFHPEDMMLMNIRLTKKEKEEAENMLQSVIENWRALKNTSVKGFRQSFLQRKGILFDQETHWTLQVEKMGFDMLLNTIPWGFGIIRLPWMKKHVQVEW